MAPRVAGLTFLFALAWSREASASCIDQASCVCTVYSVNASFVATVLHIEPVPGEMPQHRLFTFRVDQVKPAPGASTTVIEGTETSAQLFDGDAKVGEKLLGYTHMAPCRTADCATPEMEFVSLQASFGIAGTIGCGNENEVQVEPSEAMDLIQDPNCSSKMNARIEDAGGDLSCHDVFGCSAAGGSTGGELPLSAAVLAGIAIARRRRVFA